MHGVTSTHYKRPFLTEAPEQAGLSVRPVHPKALVDHLFQSSKTAAFLHCYFSALHLGPEEYSDKNELHPT